MLRLLALSCVLLGLAANAAAFERSFEADPACAFVVRADRAASPGWVEVVCQNQSGPERFWRCVSAGTSDGAYDCANQDRSDSESVAPDGEGLEFFADFCDELCDCRPQNLGQPGHEGGLRYETPEGD
jgi:hypothetical protein